MAPSKGGAFLLALVPIRENGIQELSNLAVPALDNDGDGFMTAESLRSDFGWSGRMHNIWRNAT
jgi:hypothetical protein